MKVSTRLSRRWFLMAALMTAAAAPALPALRRVRSPEGRDLAALLDRLLGSHLVLDPSATAQFASAYVARFGPASMGVYARLVLGGIFQAAPYRDLLPRARQTRIVDFERRMVSYFLRSTDYFRVPHGTQVRFVAFADPYEGGCANPLARFDF